MYERPAGEGSVFERPASERTEAVRETGTPAGEDTATRTPVSPGSQP